ncbi:unnamed protein product [Protopolystoma xenopodis]|uniref:Uncharacterized protein n=1 Tax=Protopolystoma xenopodis TaxID=117903 RepID=A0A448WHE2_9PLAT|nr:unnamed protein product [Protopolystoma xenopodis]
MLPMQRSVRKQDCTNFGSTISLGMRQTPIAMRLALGECQARLHSGPA